jgi:hypothetical protein
MQPLRALRILCKHYKCFLLIVVESRLKGMNRQNLKIINFDHTLHPGLGLEIKNSEFGVWKIVLLVMICSINADNFGSQLKNNVSKRIFSERGEGRNKSNGEDQHKWTRRFVP